MIRSCQCCGRDFIAAHRNTKYCSTKCRRQYEYRVAHERYIAAKNRRGDKSLEEKVAAADALGVSYGKYILIERGIIKYDAV